MALQNLSNPNSGMFPFFPAFEKKDKKVFGKNTVTFRHNFAYMVSSFVFHYI